MKPYLILLVLLLAVSAEALRNPAAVYCDTLGYEYSVGSAADGEIGRCTLPNNVSVDAWGFLKGKIAQGYSYCKLKGYGMKTVENTTLCARFLSTSCAVCVLSDGGETEVTELMGLTFQESVCGDSVCGYPENFSSCPQDCPLTKTEECTTCHQATSSLFPYIAVGAALAALILIIKALRKRRK